MKRIILILCLLCLVVGTAPVQAQGFLKDLSNAADKVTKTVDNAAKKVGKVTKKVDKATGNQEADSFGDYSGENQVLDFSLDDDDDYGAHDNDYQTSYDEMSYGERIIPKAPVNNTFTMSDKALHKQFSLSHFKVTPATKIIQLDDLDGLKLGIFSDGRCFVNANANGFYCIDTEGNTIKRWEENSNGWIDFPNLFFNSNRLVIISQEEKIATICDQNLKVIKKFENITNASDFKDGVAMIVQEFEQKSGFGYERVFSYIDINGNKVFSDLSEPFKGFSIGYAGIDSEINHLIRNESDGLVAFAVPPGEEMKSQGVKLLWGFRDTEGNVVIPAKYLEVQDFSNGLAAVATAVSGVMKWGFINTSGKVVIPAKFTYEPSPFDVCGYALVMNKDQERMFIDKSGNIVSEKYKRDWDGDKARIVTPFVNGKALLSDDDGYTYLINSKFERLTTIGGKQIAQCFRDDLINSYYGKLIPLQNKTEFEKYRRGYNEYTENTFIFNNEFYVPTRGGLGLLQDNGDVLIWGISGQFADGLAPVYSDDYQTGNKVAGYVNKKGEWVIKFEVSEF